MPIPAMRATRSDHLTKSSSSGRRRHRRRAVPRNARPAIPQIEIQGPELERRLELHERARAIVGEPDLRSPTFAEDPRRLDYGPNDDRIEGAGGDTHGLLSDNDDAHGILVGAKVPWKLVGLSNLEWDASQIKEEGGFVERIGNGGRFGLVVLGEGLSIGKELEIALAVVGALVDALLRTKRGERRGIEPALVVVV